MGFLGSVYLECHRRKDGLVVDMPKWCLCGIPGVVPLEVRRHGSTLERLTLMWPSGGGDPGLEMGEQVSV